MDSTCLESQYGSVEQPIGCPVFDFVNQASISVDTNVSRQTDKVDVRNQVILSDLVGQYKCVVDELAMEMPSISPEQIHFAVVQLMRESHEETLRTPCQVDLWLNIQRWSITLQRHSATRWNTMMKVISRSVTEIEELSSGEKMRAQFCGGFYGSSRKMPFGECVVLKGS